MGEQQGKASSDLPRKERKESKKKWERGAREFFYREEQRRKATGC